MRLAIKFKPSKQVFHTTFREVNNVSDGGYERGYAKGYEVGNSEGYTKGHSDGHSEGLSARTYEVWTFTLTDGTVVEKEVALI